ncbi:uncharacterized protein [Onthophagus taurus]|uniref:uncharacterized protein isoform X3 n=1 Tax=Onthophagus taurus TaxID=166361 RepID=UPI000C20415D|nr:uncharacterized protein LOC111426297 isoform X3 [Onthophagus taurus]
MIGAMPAVAVRHERRKGQEKRHKRPSQLYIAGHWLPPNSPSPTPSPNGPGNCDVDDRLPEYYVCGKVSALQLIVGSILLGAIVLIVGLVQLVPNAADADHRYIFLASGGGLLFVGFLLTGIRCYCIHCRGSHGTPPIDPQCPSNLEAVNSIDVLVQRKDATVKMNSLGYILLTYEEDSIDKPRYFN